MNPEKYPHQIDVLWLASDNDGFVAAFVSAGIAPIPTIALEMATPQIEDIEGLIQALPVTSQARLLASVKNPDSFKELAQRGLFVYDWQDVHRSTHEAIGAYELVATPSVRMRIGDLPAALHEVAVALRFAGVTFADRPRLDAREEMACIAGH